MKSARDIKALLCRFEAVAGELSEVLDGAVLPYKVAPADLNATQMAKSNAMLAALGDLDQLPADDPGFDARVKSSAGGLSRTCDELAGQLGDLVERLNDTRRALLNAGVADEVPQPLAGLEGLLVDISPNSSSPHSIDVATRPAGRGPHSGDVGVPWGDVPADHPIRAMVADVELPDVPGRGRVLAVPNGYKAKPWSVRGQLRFHNEIKASHWRQHLADERRKAEVARSFVEAAEREAAQRQPVEGRLHDLEKMIAEALGGRAKAEAAT